MNAGLHELPLILFTVFAQSAVGAFLVFAVALFQTENERSRTYIHRAMFVLLALLGVGFVCSILHLGSPLRAFNSLNRVGQSMLSNEIASGATFFAVAGLYWLLAVLNKMPQALGKIWLVAAAILGLVFMYMMANVYRIPSVPTWDTVLTPIAFYTTVVVGGTALAAALLTPNRDKDYCLKWLPFAFSAAVAVIAIALVYQAFSFSAIHTSVQQPGQLVPDFATMSALRLVALAVAGVLLYRAKSAAALAIAVVLTLGAELIGRTLFYGLHMTAGMAVGG